MIDDWCNSCIYSYYGGFPYGCGVYADNDLYNRGINVPLVTCRPDTNTAGILATLKPITSSFSEIILFPYALNQYISQARPGITREDFAALGKLMLNHVFEQSLSLCPTTEIVRFKIDIAEIPSLPLQKNPPIKILTDYVCVWK